LPDPRWVTEDDADAIMAARRRREIPVALGQALKRYRRRRVASSHPQVGQVVPENEIAELDDSVRREAIAVMTELKDDL